MKKEKSKEYVKGILIGVIFTSILFAIWWLLTMNDMADKLMALQSQLDICVAMLH